jgi:mannosylglycoprotein endo-beta-mannosidase
MMLSGPTLELVIDSPFPCIEKDDTMSPADFRPISLVHSVAKILTKVLANRLAPHLATLVSPCQSAVIKGRNIQDNFQYIQGAVNHFHCSKTPMLFLKLDIAKAFDSIRWEYMLEVMQRLGFGQRWRDLICVIWANTTSRIILNGIPGRPIKHRRGLRQRDPLSLMLFILPMDPLQRLLDRATDQGLLSPIGADPIRMRTSLYADDGALFLRPTVQDITNVQHLLNAFSNATGLNTNMQKSTMFMI